MLVEIRRFVPWAMRRLARVADCGEELPCIAAVLSVDEFQCRKTAKAVKKDKERSRISNGIGELRECLREMAPMASVPRTPGGGRTVLEWSHIGTARVLLWCTVFLLTYCTAYVCIG